MSEHSDAYGSGATIEKLDAMSRYADAYTTALKSQRFRLVYVDAFAGRGKVSLRAGESKGSVVDGSALRALKIQDKPFDRLLLIESDPKNFEKLKSEVEVYAQGARVEVIKEDANKGLSDFCDWLGHDSQVGIRAFAFLDPYAMQLNWTTVQLLAETKRVDVLMLFPLMALRRNLKSDGWPPDTHQSALQRFFGNDSWRRLYETGGDSVVRQGGDRAIVDLYAERMGEHFAEVVDPKRVLGAFDDGSLFTMLFGASNEAGANVAARIARGVFAAAQGQQGRMRL